MSARGERLWSGFAVLAALVYLVAMFAPWHSVGAYAALGTSLLVLISVAVLESGGLHELFQRQRAEP